MLNDLADVLLSEQESNERTSGPDNPSFIWAIPVIIVSIINWCLA